MNPLVLWHLSMAARAKRLAKEAAEM